MAGDLNREASELWNSLQPIIDKEIDARTQGVVQRRKAKVTTAPSLVTNTIGVTEPFGTEMFLPFNTNIMSASVGDFVWVEYMYGMTNAFVSMFASADDKNQYVAGNLTVGGVLDVTPRRCSATLSSPGWYRVLTATDQGRAVRSWMADLCITRAYGTANNEVHSVKLIATYDSFIFTDEVSKTSVLGVDKIRYTRNGGTGYVDIHYSLSTANVVAVDFSIYVRQDIRTYFTAASLEAVADSPSGETVLTEYALHANGAGDVTYNGNVTVGGVLDVVPRRCFALLSNRGWYRVFNVTGGLGRAGSAFSIVLHIGRSYYNNDTELHTVTLLANYYNQEFSSEVSKSNALGITKVRYTVDGSNNGHIDIYYNLTAANNVYVDFDVHCRAEYAYLIRYNAVTPTSVDPSPAGETVLKEYTFATITGMRVVHAQSATSFGDAIATIKDIIGDNGITWGGNAANNLHAGISGFSNGVVPVSSSGGPNFFATLGKYTANYYAAELFSYSDPWRIRIRYVNGTYYAELYYPNY